MSLVPWIRRDLVPTPLRSFRDELDELFSPLFEQPSSYAYAARPFLPLIDVKDDDEHVTVTAEVPGVDKKDIDIQVDGSTLTLRGERKEEEEEKGAHGWWRRESSDGAFTRRVTLPCDVDAAKTNASMNNGILTIRLAKAEGAKTMPIKIQ